MAFSAVLTIALPVLMCMYQAALNSGRVTLRPHRRAGE